MRIELIKKRKERKKNRKDKLEDIKKEEKRNIDVKKKTKLRSSS